MTYSIIARNPETGELGVAVQSHWFAVGPTVPWARPGVGAVATQANIRISHGPDALDLLAHGASAGQALEKLISADPGAARRQLAIIDAHGEVATHTGQGCMPYAGHITGEQVSCQANIMASAKVWPQMLDAFLTAAGPLADRLLAALDAAELAGGDIRGRQSAALLVVPATGEPWQTQVRLHVEDHPNPLVELRRLYGLHRAYHLADLADELAGQGRHAQAGALYEQALALAPENHELLFWAGLGAVQTDAVEDGLELVRAAVAQHPGWAVLLPRLSAAMAPGAQLVCARLGLA
ncbi:MAG: DUF1028 domain-containing protein [Solirubrobacteraceae bacterium]